MHQPQIFFFVASLPFIYVWVESVSLIMGINMREIYFKMHSAFVKLRPKKISWETFNYLKYRNKLDLTQIDQIYYAPKFIS
jgi:hypothetical protein